MGIMSFLMSRKGAANSQAGARQSAHSAGAGLSTDKKEPAAEAQMTGIHAKTIDMDTYLASDEKEWLRYLAQPLRTYRKPGISMHDEYKLWHSARARSKAMTAAASQRAN